MFSLLDTSFPRSRGLPGELSGLCDLGLYYERVCTTFGDQAHASHTRVSESLFPDCRATARRREFGRGTADGPQRPPAEHRSSAGRPMAGESHRVYRRSQRQNAQPRPAGPGRHLLPQRGLGLSGLHAVPRGPDDRPLADHHRHVRQRSLSARQRAVHGRSVQRGRLRHGVHRQVASRRARPRQLHPARAAARLGLLEGGRVRSQLQSFPLLRGPLPRETLLAGLRRLRANRGRPNLSSPAGEDRPAVPADGFLWSAALSPRHGPPTIQGFVPAGKDPTRAQRAPRHGSQGSPGSPRLLCPLYGAGPVYRRGDGHAGQCRTGGEHDFGLHRRSRRDAGLARLPADVEASGLG